MMAKHKRKIANPGKNVPGPTPNPATNLMMADVAMRSGTTLMRHLLERKLLKGRYGKETAQNIVHNRSLTSTAASVLIAKLATRSVPGAVMVGGGIIVKTLFDRSRKRRARKQTEDRKLLDMAADE